MSWEAVVSPERLRRQFESSIDHLDWDYVPNCFGCQFLRNVDVPAEWICRLAGDACGRPQFLCERCANQTGECLACGHVDVIEKMERL